MYSIKSEPWLDYSNPGNPLDKRRCMPFFIGSALATAGAAIGAAAAAGTAAAIGTAAVATVSALSTIATVSGLAMTVVGAVTGDKELMSIGGMVGMAGGVGALGVSVLAPAVTAATTGSAAAAAGVAADATAAAGGGAAAVGQSGSAAINGLLATGPQAGQIAAQQAAQTASSPLIHGAVSASGQGMTNLLGNGAMQATQHAAGALSSAAPTALQTAAPMVGDTVGAGVGAAAATATPGANVGANVGAGATAPQSPSFFDFLKKPEVIAGGLQGVGNYLSGKNSAQIDQARLNFEKQQYADKMNNVSTGSTFGGAQSREPTAAEVAAYQRQQTLNAKQQAKLLSGN